MSTALTIVENPHARPHTRSVLDEAQAQFERSAEHLRLDPATRKLLRLPMREHHVAIPVRMDDGTTLVFRGMRVQHNDARGRGWI